MSGNSDSRYGRPPLPMTDLERLLVERGVNRDLLLAATGYSYNYVVGVLRGTTPLNLRFIGAIVIQWPDLAQPLADYVQGVEGNGTLQAGAEKQAG